MGLLGKKKEREGKVSLIIDIRSSSVGAALVQKFNKKGSLPVVLDTFRSNIFFKETVDADDFVKRSMIALKKVLEGVKYMKVDDIHITYGSPWYVSNLELDDVNERKQVTLSRKYISELTKPHKVEVGHEGIERKLLSISINGYKSDTYVGKKAKKVKTLSYISYIYDDTKEEIEDMIDRYFRSEKIYHHTLPYLSYSVLNKEFSLPDNYVILDMSGEMTDITVVRKDMKKLISTPHGTHFFAREMTRVCKYNLETAYSKINVITSREVDEKCNDESVKSFIDAKRDWGEAVKKVLNENNIRSLPANVFVISDLSTQNLVQDILNDSEIYSSTLKFGRKPEITLINSTDIESLCNYAVDVKRDALLSLQAKYVGGGLR